MGTEQSDEKLAERLAEGVPEDAHPYGLILRGIRAGRDSLRQEELLARLGIDYETSGPNDGFHLENQYLVRW